MHDLLKPLGLTQLVQALPTLLDEARQQQLSYEAFLRQALQTELTGRHARALQRRQPGSPVADAHASGNV